MMEFSLGKVFQKKLTCQITWVCRGLLSFMGMISSAILHHAPLHPEGGRLKVGKSSRHGILKRRTKISSKNKHDDNRPKLILPAIFARLNCRLFPSILPVSCCFLISASVILTVVFASMYDFARPPSDPIICPIVL